MIGLSSSGALWWSLTLWAAPPHVLDHGLEEACGLEPPDPDLRIEAVPAKSGQPLRFDAAAPFVRADGFGDGALRGKTVYVSAGHGLVWTDYGWRAQRGNTHDIVEDIVSIEAVNQYLVPYLHAMGAYVVTVREPDLRREAVIVDDDDATIVGPIEEGDASMGWGPVALPIVSDATNPFASGSARTMIAKATASGEMGWAPAIPQSGHYNVYVSFVQGSDRVSDAHYVVRHSGGETHFRIDQRRHGGTWVLLGSFHFEAGAPADRAAVAVLDDSQDIGGVISCDAVRFGGGVAVHDRGGGANDRPLYEQAARYYAQWSGAPSSVFAQSSTDGNSDVSTRSRFAAWEHEDGEDAVYVAWHTNAPSPRRGTSSYTYGDSAPPGSLSNFSGVAGSRELQDAVHLEIVDDIRAQWDPEWTDDGRFTAYFGEVNPSHNPEMPSVLVEVAYHDTLQDADQLRDPGFRRIVARAMAHGIARYFAERDGTPLALPPEPPAAVSLRNIGDGRLEVRFRAPEPEPGGGDAPTGYLVQVSTNGWGFDDGTPVDGDRFVLEGLEADDIRFVRVMATNAGGRSLPSPTVGARVAASGEASVLVVAGFDRLDSSLLLRDDLSPFDLGVVDRMWLARMNDGTHAVRHALAIADAGFSFDGTTDEAIEFDDIELGPYQAIDWFTGVDSVADEPLGSLARDALDDYLDGGGALFISGAELGFALDGFGSPEEQTFFNGRLHARYLLDDAETYDVAPTEGIFADLPPLSFSDPSSYDAQFPDVLEPVDGVTVLAYQNGTGVGAGIAWGAEGRPDRGIVLGFPFETIADEDTRAELMARALEFFEVVEAPGPDPDDDDTSGGTEDGSGSGDDEASEDDSAVDASGSGDPGQAETGGADGCGCRSEPNLDPAFVGLGLVALGLVRRRRGRLARDHVEASPVSNT